MAFNWTAPGGQHAENVMHFRGTGLNPGGLAAALDASADAGMFGFIAGGVVASTCSITQLDGTSPTVSQPLTNWAGASAGTDWVPAAGALITAYTATRGRRSRGRIYLPFCPETVMNDGKVTAINAANCSTAWNEFLTDLASDFAVPIVPVVASYGRPDRAHPLGWTPAAYDITSYVCRERLATQRLRQSRVA